VEVYIPPVEIPNAPQPPIPPIVVSTPIEPPAAPWSRTPNIAGPVGGGTQAAVVHSSSPAISNLDKCKPTYPSAAVKSEEEGTTRLKLDVGANGQLAGASVVKSSGFPDLDRAAVRALSQCEFKAATQDGTPVQSSLVTDYIWSLQQ
jgi:protein TonB